MAQAGFPFTGLQSEGAGMNYGAVVQGLNQLSLQLSQGTPTAILSSGTSSATANAALMQAAANSGYLSIAPQPGVYYFNSTIVLPSLCDVVIPSGVELRAVPVTPSVAGNNFRAFTNANFQSTYQSISSITPTFQTPYASGSLGTIATVVTSAAHPFTGLTRQFVYIRGDYNDMYNGIFEVNTVVNSTTFTIAMGQGSAGLAASYGDGPAMQMAPADAFINITGGGTINMDSPNTAIWTDRTAANAWGNPGPNYLDHCIAFNKVLKPRVEGIYIQKVRRYGVMLQTCVESIVRRVSFDTFADGVHHYGPQWDPLVEDVIGTTGDDGVIFQPIDGASFSQYQAEATGGNIYRPKVKRLNFRHTRNDGALMFYCSGGNAPTAISVNTIANNVPATISGTPVGTGGTFSGGSTYQLQVVALNTMTGQTIYAYTAQTAITIAASGSVTLTLPTAPGFLFSVYMGVGALTNFAKLSAAQNGSTDAKSLMGGQALTLTDLGGAGTPGSVTTGQLFTFTGTPPAAGNAVIFTAAQAGVIPGKTYYVLPWGLSSTTMLISTLPRGAPLSGVTTGSALTLTGKWDVGYQFRGNISIEDVATQEGLGGGIAVGSTSYVPFGCAIDNISAKNISGISFRMASGDQSTMATVGSVVVENASNDLYNGSNMGSNFDAIIGVYTFRAANFLNVNNNTFCSPAAQSNIGQLLFDSCLFRNADSQGVLKLINGNVNTLNRITFRDCVFGAGVQGIAGGTFANTPLLEIIGGRAESAHGAMLTLNGGSQSMNVLIRDFDNANQIFNILTPYSGTLKLNVMGLGNSASIFSNFTISGATITMQNPDGTCPVDITKLSASASGQIARHFVGTANFVPNNVMAVNNGAGWQVLGGAKQTITAAGSMTPDFSAGNLITISTLGAGPTAYTINNPSNMPTVIGETAQFTFADGGGAGNTVSWGTNYVFPTAFTVTGIGSTKKSTAVFRFDGTNLIAIGANSWA